MVQPSVCMLQQKSKIPRAITKIWYSQINKYKFKNIFFFFFFCISLVLVAVSSI